MLWNLMFNFSLILSQISLYLSNALSFLAMKHMFFTPFSKYFMYPHIWGKIIHNGLIIWPSLWPIKYLKPSSLCLNLSATTIWSVFIKFKSIAYLDLWNSFLLSLILSSFSVFLLILIILRKNKTYFVTLLFPTESVLDNFLTGTP